MDVITLWNDALNLPSGLVLGTVYLSCNAPTTFAFDKPLLSAIVFLTTSGVSLIGLGRYLPKDGGKALQGQQYQALPLEDVGQPHASREPSPSPEGVRYPSSQRKLRIVFVVLVLALCLRVEILLRILGNVQCSSLTSEPLIPFVFACYDYWSVHRHKKRPLQDDPTSSAYDAAEQHFMRAQWRYLAAVGLFSVGGMLAIGVTRSPNSTYICAASLSFHWLTPLLQRVGTVLDVVIAYCIAQLLQEQEGRNTRSMALRCVSLGWALVVSLTSISVYLD